MHMVIRAVVPATTSQEALECARGVFDGLVENGHPFDYYTMFNEDGTSVSGQGRYGELPAVSDITSTEGKELLENGMEANKREFLDHLAKLRKMLVHTDSELFECDDTLGSLDGPAWFRYTAHHIGQYVGSSIWLYDQYGSGIRNPKELEEVLHQAEHEQKRVWIVPADVHM